MDICLFDFFSKFTFDSIFNLKTNRKWSNFNLNLNLIKRNKKNVQININKKKKNARNGYYRSRNLQEPGKKVLKAGINGDK